MKLSQIPPCWVCVGKILIKVFLVGLSWNLKLIEVVLFWFRKLSGEIGQKYPFLFQPDTSLPPKRRSACLGKGLRLGEHEAPKFSVSASASAIFDSPWRT